MTYVLLNDAPILLRILEEILNAAGNVIKTIFNNHHLSKWRKNNM